MGHRWQTILRLAIGTAATVAFLLLFLRIAHLGDAWREIMNLPWWSAAAAVGFVVLNSAFIALRWRYLFSAARYRTGSGRLFAIFCVGAGANNILPARGGDLLRIESVRQHYRIPPFVTAGTLFAERLLDGVVLSVWILVGALLSGQTGILLLAGIGLSAGCTLGIVIVALAARRPERAEELVWKWTKRLPGQWHVRAGRWTANFVEGLGAFRARQPLMRVLWTSAAIWLADLGMYWVVGLGFGVGLDAGGYLLLEGVGNLALGVPATAAGLGSFDYLTLVSARELGMPESLGTPYVLTVHAMVVIPVTIIGAFFLRSAFPRVFGAARSERAHEAYREA
ncbi:MAG: flippase-like domain-containing protein [Thermoleophilia bacterium]|nr:flippase-like domain-containing protein [Thermoleophilia bacterium]